jgi:DNA-binding PadR family transcriptional regulator
MFKERLAELGLGDTDPSVVYRALRDMEDRGWATSIWDEEQSQGPPRRVYSLTPLGGDVLKWWIQDLRGTRKMIDDVLELYERHMADEGEHIHDGSGRASD